jgi:hypothetical protein
VFGFLYVSPWILWFRVTVSRSPFDLPLFVCFISTFPLCVVNAMSTSLQLGMAGLCVVNAMSTSLQLGMAGLCVVNAMSTSLQLGMAGQCGRRQGSNLMRGTVAVILSAQQYLYFPSQSLHLPSRFPMFTTVQYLYHWVLNKDTMSCTYVHAVSKESFCCHDLFINSLDRHADFDFVSGSIPATAKSAK